MEGSPRKSGNVGSSSRSGDDANCLLVTSLQGLFEGGSSVCVVVVVVVGSFGHLMVRVTSFLSIQ